MERSPPTKKRFFKVMVPGFQDKLNLPRAFCEKLNEGEPEGAILESRKGTWEVKACRNGEGVICLKDGWPQFACCHNLSVGDFVVFEHVDQLRFNVSVFGPNNCEREFLVKRESEESEEERPTSHSKKIMRDLDNSVGSYHSKNPYFVVTMKHCHSRGQVSIPLQFVKSNDLLEKTSVSLRDPGRNEWAVRLLIDEDGYGRRRIGRGWHEFYVSNEIKEGDVCVFDLLPSSPTSTTISFDVKILRS